MRKLFNILLLFIVVCFSNCRNNELRLKRIDIPSGAEIDTLERFPEKSMLLVNIVTNRAFGRFYTNYAIVKILRDGKELVYEMPQASTGQGSRISKDYVAYVNSYGKANWGWFVITNGEMKDDLPGIKKILDSLKSIQSPKFHIAESHGYIMFFLNEKIVKTANYGEFITKYSHQQFDNLDCKLYKLVHDSLTVASNNANDLLKQKDGIFFIPLPGFGIVDKYSKKDILNAVDSVSRLKDLPSNIEIKAVN